MDKLGWLAWPGVVLVLGVLFLVLFRRPIASFLSRATEVSKTGIKAAASQANVVEVSSSAAAEGLIRSFDSVVIRSREDAILQFLEGSGVHVAQDQVKVLARHLAVFQLGYFYQRIDRMIFGSQLEILLSLNSMASPIPRESVRPYYDVAVAGAPEFFSTYPFDSYLGFLSSNALIKDSGGQVAITPEGRDFLVFLAQTGSTARRPL